MILEIETTLAELPKRLKALQHPPHAKVRLLIEEDPLPETPSRWLRLAGRLQSDAPLSGAGSWVLAQSKAFREEFAFPQDTNDS